VFSVFKEGAAVMGGNARRVHAIKKIWIERSTLTIARQQVYQEEGRIASDITYSEMTQSGGFALPLKIRIDRPLDGYTLDMQFRNWRINPELPDNAFVLPPPAGAQVVPFREKGRSAVS
jgi:outer membrane lipoprotein-sorting protein